MKWFAQLSQFIFLTYQAIVLIYLPSALSVCQLIQSPCVKIRKRYSALLHPNISVYILNTVLCTFPNVPYRRIC